MQESIDKPKHSAPVNAGVTQSTWSKTVLVNELEEQADEYYLRCDAKPDGDDARLSG